MTTAIQNILWVLLEVSRQAFWTFFLLYLLMYFLDPRLNEFFSRNLPMLDFLVLSFVFLLLYFYRLIEKDSPS